MKNPNGLTREEAEEKWAQLNDQVPRMKTPREWRYKLADAVNWTSGKIEDLLAEIQDDALRSKPGRDARLNDALTALYLAKTSVECASLDKDGNELPWYKMAKKVLYENESQ